MKAPAQRTPAVVAIERLAKLAAGGASAARMVAALDGILAEWGAAELADDEMRERVEQMQADVDAGLEAAQDYRVVADTPAGIKAAEGQVEALQAVCDRLGRLTG